MSDTPHFKRWMGLPHWLALVNFILTALGIAGGTLWSVSVWLSEYRYASFDNGRQIILLHDNMVDVDRRINETTAKEAELRRAFEGAIAEQKEHISVLEAQMKFVADRVPPAMLPAGTRR